MEDDNSRIKPRRLLDEVLDSHEEESFFVTLMYWIQGFSRHNRKFLEREEAFTRLIDFPEQHKEEREDDETTNRRKVSFALYEEE